MARTPRNCFVPPLRMRPVCTVWSNSFSCGCCSSADRVSERGWTKMTVKTRIYSTGCAGWKSGEISIKPRGTTFNKVMRNGKQHKMPNMQISSNTQNLSLTEQISYLRLTICGRKEPASRSKTSSRKTKTFKSSS